MPWRPGIAPDMFAIGMEPVPPPLVQTGREMPPEEIFWVAKHGLKMTGMPGWDTKLPDDEIWNIVAFVRRMLYLSPVEYRKLAGLPEPAEEPTPAAVVDDLQPGSAEEGKLLIRQFGCIACHTVEGVVGPDAWVGPPLRQIEEREYIAGGLPNSPANLVRWITRPQQVDPLTAMPATGVTEDQARDIVAYLYSAD